MLKALLHTISILFVLGTYYGAWQHNWIIILLCFFPQVLRLGYSLKGTK